MTYWEAAYILEHGSTDYGKIQGTCGTCGARILMAYKYYEYCPHCGTKNEVTT